MIALGGDAFRQVTQPLVVDDQRVSALRFDDPRVQALLSALLLFVLLPRGFSNRDLRQHLAPLLGLEPGELTQGKMTYDRTRLRLRGIIERIPKSHRHRLTPFGLRAALFMTRVYNRVYNRVLRPGLADLKPVAPASGSKLRSSFHTRSIAPSRRVARVRNSPHEQT